MAKDARSYKKHHFERAIGILGKNGLIASEHVARLESLVRLVETQIKDEMDTEEQYGDIPDEFLGEFADSVAM